MSLGLSGWGAVGMGGWGGHSRGPSRLSERRLGAAALGASGLKDSLSGTKELTDAGAAEMSHCEGRNFPARRDEQAPQKMLEGLQNLGNTDRCQKKNSNGQNYHYYYDYLMVPLNCCRPQSMILFCPIMCRSANAPQPAQTQMNKVVSTTTPSTQ